jgi:hypothetical protein
MALSRQRQQQLSHAQEILIFLANLIGQDRNLRIHVARE